DLLRDDGVIFISIDDNEQAQLKLLCDEVFGEENFVALFPWRKRTAKSDVPYGVSQDYEWIMCYAKANFIAGNAHERKYHQTPDFPNDPWRLSDLTKQTSADERPNSAFNMVDPKTGKSYPFNPKRTWAVSKDTFQDYYDKKKIVFPDDYDFLKIKIPAYRVFESEDKAKAVKKYGSENAIKSVPTLLPKEVGLSEHGNKDFVALFNEKFFSFPKPVKLLQYLIECATNDDDIILDFFSGSGTTAEAVMRLNAEDGGNRSFILVQIPQAIDPQKQKEAYRFVTEALNKPATIFEITAERLRRAGQKIEAEAAVDTGFRVFDIIDDTDALILQKPLSEVTQADLSIFIQHNTDSDSRERVLYNLLLSEGLPLTTMINELIPNTLYLADEVALILGAVDLTQLTDTLKELNHSATPAVYLTVYAPWVRDDNFMLGLKTLAESLGFSSDKLRLRG
ncbi:MAG: site-specific DNA-methyltransferase, partial [Methylococcales bacterium]|nr:site-specific DNA-methyltransferase [Methylococcales bacterium]